MDRSCNKTLELDVTDDIGLRLRRSGIFDLFVDPNDVDDEGNNFDYARNVLNQTDATNLSRTFAYQAKTMVVAYANVVINK